MTNIEITDKLNELSVYIYKPAKISYIARKIGLDLSEKGKPSHLCNILTGLGWACATVENDYTLYKKTSLWMPDEKGLMKWLHKWGYDVEVVEV